MVGASSLEWPPKGGLGPWDPRRASTRTFVRAVECPRPVYPVLINPVGTVDEGDTFREHSHPVQTYCSVRPPASPVGGVRIFVLAFPYPLPCFFPEFRVTRNKVCINRNEPSLTLSSSETPTHPVHARLFPCLACSHVSSTSSSLSLTKHATFLGVLLQ